MHPNDLTWSRYLASDLGLLQRWRFERHIHGCAKCQAKKEALVLEQQRFAQHPSRDRELAILRAVRAEPLSVVERKRIGPLWWLALPSTAIALAGLAIMLRAPSADSVATVSEAEVFRSKGATFSVFVKRGDEAIPIGPTCKPGDRLRARFASDRPFVFVVGIDALGTVQALHPLAGRVSARISGEGFTPTAFELDETPGRQRFVAIFSDQPLSFDEVAAWAKEGAPQPNPKRIVLVEQACTVVAR